MFYGTENSSKAIQLSAKMQYFKDLRPQQKQSLCEFLKWTDFKHKGFETNKCIVDRNNLILYTNVINNCKEVRLSLVFLAYIII